MKLLGFVFLLILLLAAVGYFRGWFSVTTAHASGKSGVELTIDDGKLGDDAKAVTGQLSESKVAAEAEVSAAAPASSEVECVLAVVDVVARNLTVTVGSRTMVQHVATAVAITRDGESLGMAELRAEMRAKLVFDRASEPRELLRVEIL